MLLMMDTLDEVGSVDITRSRQHDDGGHVGTERSSSSSYTPSSTGHSISLDHVHCKWNGHIDTLLH